MERHNTYGASYPPICSSCQDLITESHLLKVDDKLWHEDCLRCNCCNCRLGEVGSSLYTRAELLLCKRDYLRMFGSIGYCNACEKVIPAFELVMRAGLFVYHLECFGCQECNHRFCVGDKCYLYGNRILCEADYEEIMLYNKIASQIPLSCGMMMMTQQQQQQPPQQLAQYHQAAESLYAGATISEAPAAVTQSALNCLPAFVESGAPED